MDSLPSSNRSAFNPSSRITGGKTVPLFTAKVLGKYSATYHQCVETGFIQTDEPQWLPEAYSNAITALDLGLVSRNMHKAMLTETLIDRCMPTKNRFLDFGGGYGMFTRLMRDRGYDFVHYDLHCKNLFAVGCEVKNLETLVDSKFDLVTAWEVFEHVVDPKCLLQQLSSAANVVLFSTELVPERTLRSPEDWWYFTPETGQHISFYTSTAFRFLARESSLYFYSDNICNHILSSYELAADPFAAKPVTLRDRLVRRLLPQMIVELTMRLMFPSGLTDRYLNRLYPKHAVRKSLLESDFQVALATLRNTDSK